MAAYGAIVSLQQTIERLLKPSHSKILLPSSEMEFITEEFSCYLKSKLESIKNFSSSERVGPPDFGRRVKDAVIKYEDLIDSHISDLFLSGDESTIDDESFTLALSQQELQVRQEIQSYAQELERIDEEYEREDEKRLNSFVPSRMDHSSGEKKLVGMDYQLEVIEDFLLLGEPNLKVLIVAGMAGIGKTVAVKEVYYDPDVIKQFEHRLFLSIGPHYQLKETLLHAFSLLGGHSDKIHKDVSVHQLSDYIRESLSGRKYVIVLDDAWDEDMWGDLELVFPDDKNGSRIILTSQNITLLTEYSTIEETYEMPLLNNDESWNLLHQMVFSAEEHCHPQLEKIGRKIAKKCEGLPLAIIEVGKLLCKIEKTVQDWKLVADREDPLTITTEDDTLLSKAISLSYWMLPQFLKVCFLYMGVFPKRYEIRSSKLIKLWVSEGFMQPEVDDSLEECAEIFLNSLVDRSVVLNNKLRSKSLLETKSCRLHFTFRSLCVNEAKKERFLHIIKKYSDCFPENIDSQSRLGIHNHVVLAFKQVHSWMESVPNARSLLCVGPRQQYPIVLYLRFRLLKVLDALPIRFYEFPSQVLELLHLRYLAITYDGQLPACISYLGNLEVLIVHRHQSIKSSNDPVYLPVEIWKLHKLKHLQCMAFDLLDPTDHDDDFVLKNILTLSGVTSHSCTRGVLARMPNLMKLGIRIESTHDAIETFSFLGDFTSVYEEFESFKCIVINPNLRSRVVYSVMNFPANITKISLSGCGFPWKNMRVIAKLPNLGTLKLRWYAFCGPKWRTYKREFPKLEFLLLEDLDIQHWRTHIFHFPMLECLIIRHCYKLREFPFEAESIGELEVLEVDDCRPSVMVSARDMQAEILSYGYDQPRIHSSGDDEKPKSYLDL